MNQLDQSYVLDASVGIKLCVTEALSDKADALVTMAGADPPWLLFVPDLFYAECANVLWKHVWKSGHSPQQALRDMELLRGLRLLRTPTADLAGEALRIALADQITAYDACYFALAQKTGAPLVTADERLLRKMANTPHRIEWLGDLELPNP